MTASPPAVAVPSATPAPSVATPAPSQAPSPSASLAAAFPLTLTDDEGTEVTIPAEPLKIASLTNAATEMLFALGVGDRVVGKVEDFTPYPPEAAAVPDVAKFGSVDVEKIVAMGTDLVIAGGSNFNPPEAIDEAALTRRPGPRPVRAGRQDRARRHLADRAAPSAATEEAAELDVVDPGRRSTRWPRRRPGWPSRASTTSSTTPTATSAPRPTTSAPR